MTTNSKATIKGIIQDDIAVKNIMVFNDDDKVFYKNFLPEDKNLKLQKFSISIPLHKNANAISVVAEDYEGLSSREQWVIWKK